VENRQLEIRTAEWSTAMRQTERFSLDRTARQPSAWDKLAPDFDDGLGNDFVRVARTVEILTEKGALNKNTVAIDIGCGTGTFTLELAKHCKKIYALDFSPMMLDRLNEKVKSCGLDNVVTICGDWNKMELSEFDPEINLALSCLNPGINDTSSLDKMNKVSKRWCCYISVSGTSKHTSRNELQEIVFGRTLNNANGNDVIFPFNVIYAMGLKPDLNYIPCKYIRLLTEERALESIVSDFTRYKDLDGETVRELEKYINDKLDESGKFLQETSMNLGIMIWET
jgi:ubiquinone/menaquinone biosynthesis C-methylase UbiE